MASLWTDGVSLPSFPSLDHDLETDVLIIGGGLCGVLCAYRLEQAGVRYALIEAGRVCGGVSARTTAKITSQHSLIYHRLLQGLGPERARQYYDANEAALAQYRALCPALDCDFETRDAYVYQVGGTDRLEKEKAALDRLGIPADALSRLPIPVNAAGAIRFRDQAQFHPLKFVRAIADGLHIFEHTAARAWDGHAVVTDSGRITARRIVVATHFPLFNKHGAYFLKLYQHRSYVLALSGAQDVHGMYLDERDTGLSLRNAGDLLLLGGGAHRTGKPGGCWAELSAFAKKAWPDAREVCRWATQDCMTLDGVPYIGRYAARTPSLYVATGFNKWGMTTSMLAAGLLCDLLLDRANDCAALFSPSRSMLHRQLLVNGLEATASLLTPTRPRCPHMGCALKWNTQEHSWDCACHGSRFGEDGRLLNNPATGKLNVR
ncbi:MAG: FAD-dependent oxidoreductase [Candidatus Ventricola sp.]